VIDLCSNYPRHVLHLLAVDGMIKLSRRIVSVQEHDMLKVFVLACSPAGDEERCEASFVVADASVSSGVKLKIGSCHMEATVAWSLFCDDYCWRVVDGIRSFLVRGK
jgi:hypothetical protein